MLNSRALNQSFLHGGGLGADVLIQVGGNTINGGRKTLHRINTLQVSFDLGSRSSAQFQLTNFVTIPLVGELVRIYFRRVLKFAGSVHTIERERDRSGNVNDVRVECVGPEHGLERILVTQSYADVPLQTIIDDLIASYLMADGYTAGEIDGGPLFVLADGDHIRASEFLRDVAGSAGGVLLVTPLKEIDVRRTTFDPGPFQVTNDGQFDITVNLDREFYRNAQVVRVTGINGNEETIERDDASEIEARQAIEGGTGRYERFDEISHPTSDASADLIRLGITYAIIRLRISAAIRKTLSFSTRLHGFAVGQLLDVSLSDIGAAGDWLITKFAFRDEDGIRLLYDAEARQTDPQNLAMEAYLSLVEAARATIVLADVPNAPFDNSVVFETAGVHEFEVPGVGDVQIELDLEASGAGAGGGYIVYNYYSVSRGGHGGNGGRVHTFLTVPAGTIITINIGANGVGGIVGTLVFGFPFDTDTPSTPGTDAGDITAEVDSEIVARANGGDLGTGGGFTFGTLQAVNGVDGAPGGGEGDVIVVGGGRAGGQGVVAGNGNDGTLGRVTVRY